MSTRSGIGFPVGDVGMRFCYCHSDGYPSGNGKWLSKTIPGFFGMDLAKAEQFFFRDHPGGFSSLCVSDLSYPCGWNWDSYPGSGASEEALREYYKHPVCYCHGGRSENRDGSEDRIAEYRAIGDKTFEKVSPTCYSDIEYVHLIGKGGLSIMSVDAWTGNKLTIQHSVSLTWEQMDAMSDADWESLDRSFWGD